MERGRIEELEALLAAALGRIVELEGQLRQNSRNSSKPPSSDMGRRKIPKETTGRKPGGQPGHPGTMRDPVPPDQVGEIVDMDPETCANCGAQLEAAPRLDADIRQILETPEFQAFVREFRLWKKRCPKCGGFTRGKMPVGSPKGAFGPRIQAMVAMLSGRFRLSRREAQALMRLLVGVEMSLGSVQACCEAASEAMAETHEDLHAEVKAVLWRKGSFGINSEAGARFVERILTLAGTTRRRGIDLLGWLTEAIQAELDGVPPPALA